ncbi:hypothetical protein CAEBREN_08988 [Caenorhabditis brenneri]|uniref:Uncharacterized protein n=1 Tax=Caenorhabditis brenneri TaxID=135651 RepID=G0P393_CAEBE|nr:hypothetical protein CAEBREN_08988 [Caenorhabditis brenneri]
MDEELYELHAGLPATDIIYQLRDIPIQETPVREDDAVVIIGAHEEPPNNRWNRPYRVVMVHVLTFLTLLANPTMESYQLWIQREAEWEPNDIPLLATDKSALRIHVWRGDLPNPQKHAQEVLKRLHWITEYFTAEQFTEWFLRRARGSPQIDQNRERTRRCLLCGSHILGFPLDNHTYNECIFRRIPGTARIRFMAINNRAFCNQCGSWSTTHTNDRCQHRSCRCGALDHQISQDLCVNPNGPQLDTRQQDRIALQAIKDHYDLCDTLIRDNQLEYQCPGDSPSDHTRQLFRKLRHQGINLLLIGWAKFIHLLGDYRSKSHMEYPSRIRYRGLITPEESSARVNSHPMFPAEEIDTALMYGMVIDHLRFGTHWIRTRRGNTPILTRPEDLGRRAALRRAMPRLPPRPPVIRPPAVPPLDNVNLNPRDLRAILEPFHRRMAQLIGNRPRVPPRQDGGAPAQHPEPADNGEGNDLQIQAYARPVSPEDVRPGQRRQVQVSDDEEDDFGLIYREPPSSDSDEDEVPEEPAAQTSESEDSDDQGNPIIIRQFNRGHNMWFNFNTHDEVVHEMEELEQEQAFKNSALGRIRIHMETRQVTTNVGLLEQIANRRIPHHRPAIQARIGFLIRSLTGHWHTPNYTETLHTIEELQSYIAYLQGVHRFLVALADVGHFLPVKICSCQQLLQDPKQTHQLAIPTMETFLEQFEDHYFLFAENNWFPIHLELQRDRCNCTRNPNA